MKKFASINNIIVPAIERMLRWVVRTFFELLQLTGLAYATMQLISASFAVEIACTMVVVFSAHYFSKYWK